MGCIFRKTSEIFRIAFFFLIVAIGSAGASDTIFLGPKTDRSLRNEILHSIDSGLKWLSQKQTPQGWWSQPEHPALTALVLEAFMEEPRGDYRASWPPMIGRGYEYLLKCQKEDGGIYVRDLANYNTSVSMMALLSANRPEYEQALRRARNFVVGQQDHSQNRDSAMTGGIGYGGRYEHSDLSNTTFALESLYYTQHLRSDMGDLKGMKELNWQAALKFVQRCQNLPQYNDQPWASNDPDNQGGFVYFPGNSKAGEVQLPDGKTALRSYGSISYAGLLSYIYARLEKNDPRIQAVHEWLSKHYTLEENPGLGQQGLYYYYHMMSKALSTYGVHQLHLAGGQKVNWRKDLALRLLDLQQPDGFWINENGRWWERDPVLVTSYAIITLEIVYRGL